MVIPRGPCGRGRPRSSANDERARRSTRSVWSAALTAALVQPRAAGVTSNVRSLSERRRRACRPAAVPAAALAKTYVDRNVVRAPRSHGRDAHAPAGGTPALRRERRTSAADYAKRLECRQQPYRCRSCTATGAARVSYPRSCGYTKAVADEASPPHSKCCANQPPVFARTKLPDMRSIWTAVATLHQSPLSCSHERCSSHSRALAFVGSHFL
jgi:hypothetical protein